MTFVFQVPENIIFDHGLWMKYRDIERTKRWNSLRHIENRAQLSKYKLDCDFMGVKNKFNKQIDLAVPAYFCMMLVVLFINYYHYPFCRKKYAKICHE